MEDDEFSIEALEALNQESISLPPVADVKSKYKVRQTEPFLRGPVPMSWFIKANEVAGGNGLMLGLKLWWLSGMARSRTFSVNVRRLEAGQSLISKRRMLKLLEGAGLIKRSHQPGKRLKVELLVKKQEARGPP
jgi:hypothetical protein